MLKKEESNHPLRLLFHMHIPHKRKPRNSMFLPLFIIRSQLTAVCMVAFSFNPILQLGSCALLYLVFGIYSLICCPYRNFIRACLHISDLALLAQSVMLYLVISSQYGQYSLDILTGDGGVYNFAWALIALNYLQMVIYAVLALGILFNLGKEKLCKPNSVLAIASEREHAYDGRMKKLND